MLKIRTAQQRQKRSTHPKSAISSGLSARSLRFPREISFWDLGKRIFARSMYFSGATQESENLERRLCKRTLRKVARSESLFQTRTPPHDPTHRKPAESSLATLCRATARAIRPGPKSAEGSLLIFQTRTAPQAERSRAIRPTQSSQKVPSRCSQIAPPRSEGDPTRCAKRAPRHSGGDSTHLQCAEV